MNLLFQIDWFICLENPVVVQYTHFPKTKSVPDKISDNEKTAVENITK